MTRLWRFSSYTLTALVLVGIVAVACLYLVLATESGSRWLIDKAVDRLSPQVSYSALSGTLQQGITLEAVAIPLPDQGQMDIGVASGQWNLWDLLGGQLPIKQLHIVDLSITLAAESGEPDKELTAWPSLALPLPVDLKNVTIKDLHIQQGEQRTVIDRIALKAAGGPFHTRIRELVVEQDNNRLLLSGRINNQPPYNSSLNLSWQFQPTDQPLYKGQAKVSGSLEKLQLEHQLLAPHHVETRGQLTMPFERRRMAINPGQIYLSSTSTWHDLDLEWEKNTLKTAGTLTVEGLLDDLAIDLTGRLELTPDGSLNEEVAALAQQPVDVVLSAHASLQQLDQIHLDLHHPAISLSAEGQLAWEQSISWLSRLDVDVQNLSLLYPDLKGNLTASLTSEGNWGQESRRVEVTIARVQGRLGSAPINGSGQLQLENQHYRFQQIALEWGGNQARINGQVGEKLNLDWSLNSPQLHDLLPTLQGSITSQGSIRGSRQSPLIELELTARHLRYQALAADNLLLSASSPSPGLLNATLKGTGVDLPGLQNSQLEMSAQGGIADHHLTMAFSHQDIHSQLTLSGGYQQQRWQGQVDALSITDPVTGPWQTSAPSRLLLGNNHIELSELCLRQTLDKNSGGQDAKTCFTASFRQDTANLQWHAEGLQLSLFRHWIPAELQLEGSIRADLAVQGPLKSLSGAGHVQVPDGVILYQHPDSKEPEVHQFTLATNINLQPKSLIAENTLTVANAGAFQADITVKQPLEQGAMQGNIEGQFDNLHWLDGFFPAVEALNGQAKVRIALTGTPRTPRLDGKLELHNLTLQIPQAGLQLEDGEATIQLDSNQAWRIDAGINADQGHLMVNGQGSLDSTGSGLLVVGQVNLSGDQFPVVNHPDMRLIVTPDIDITLETQRIAVTGDLNLQEGKLVLEPLANNAVEVSGDEVIYPRPAETTPTYGRPLKTDINLNLGQDFHFSGYGLTSGLQGSLRITQENNGVTRGFGNIHLHDGLFKAYGQKLVIESGVLLFQGPLNDPGLNIKAVRDTRYAKVGLLVGGTASDISSELFSIPTLPSTDIISILVTGKPLSDANASDANQVANAAAALGIAKSGWITSKVQNTFGLDTLKLQGGDTYEESALVVGKYLTPDLFVSYLQNLFSPEGAVQLDYSLTEHLGLKAISGEEQSIDLLYKIEH